MSTAATPPSGAVPENVPPTPPGAVPVYEVPAPGAKPEKKLDYLVVYGHSNLLYWWPVWLVSFVLAGVTYMEGHQMAVVPRGAVVEHNATVAGIAGTRDIVVAPEGQTFRLAPEEGKKPTPGMTVSSNNNLGVIFVATIVLVALTSTILLRGLVSLVAVVLLITLTVTFALFGWWNDILAYLGGLDIRMNAAGYLAVGIPLFLAWLVVVLLYDRQIYMVFDQGQIRYVREVGDSEVVMQSEGAIVEKKRNDVFRHWLLGFGTGDLMVRTGGPNGPTIELENVINIGRKLTIINQMVKEKAITIDS
jgi:hypothetical protein